MFYASAYSKKSLFYEEYIFLIMKFPSTILASIIHRLNYSNWYLFPEAIYHAVISNANSAS